MGAIAILALISGSRADVTCDDCLTFGGAMLDYLMSDASIAEQTGIIVANVCPGAEDPAGCEAGMRAWWSGIAMAMYPVFLEPNDVCMQLGACAIKTLIGSEEKIAEVIAFLDGDGFCGTSPDPATCVTAIDATMPYVMPVLAGVLSEGAAGYCCELS